ncbi:MAG TPA: hypothetical protein PLP29_02235 [Candidatus Ozemobacteraceae bacterium]|nr:hypothetical protein [Candidatus Ozemobacteraceae bacterium]
MKRQGTVILMLLVALMIGGIVAMRLIPGIEIQEQRQKNVQLKMALGQIRQAFAMRAAASATYNPDLSNKNAIANELSSLAQLNYLNDPTQMDRHVPGHRWGTGTGDVYWKAADNIAENTSFEVTDTAGTIASWQIEAQTTLTRDWFYLGTTEIDDFPGENKLGITLGLSGRSVRIDR